MGPSNVIPCEVNTEIIRRYGPTVLEYVEKFRSFLYLRTGYRFENFRTPRHFQRLLDEMSFNRVPIAVWENLLKAVLRIASMFPNGEERARHFGAFFIDVLCWLFQRLSRMGILRIAIFLLAFEVHPLIAAVIGTICLAMEYFLTPLWKEFSKFLQSHLITAPYYLAFTSA